MRLRTALPLALAVALLADATPAHAQARGVGLGAAAGFAVPSSGDIDYSLGFNWGFFVDIPLIWTFHITPSALIYRLSTSNDTVPGNWNTDLSLNFKFVVPLGPIEPFGGILAGMTADRADLEPHVGLLAGLSVHLIANIDVFAQLNYKVTLRDEGNLKDLQIYAGPLFRFY